MTKKKIPTWLQLCGKTLGFYKFNTGHTYVVGPLATVHILWGRNADFGSFASVSRVPSDDFTLSQHWLKSSYSQVQMEDFSFILFTLFCFPSQLGSSQEWYFQLSVYRFYHIRWVPSFFFFSMRVSDFFESRLFSGHVKSLPPLRTRKIKLILVQVALKRERERVLVRNYNLRFVSRGPSQLRYWACQFSPLK